MMIGGSSIMTVAHVLPAPAVAPNRSVAAVIGNAMEWYDFAVYGFFASIIGKLFFPTSEPSLSVIAALAVFAVGFLMRPIGGIAFGYVGDRYGRTLSLFLSIGAMAVGTLAMGLLPTYETAGMLAPILMITCRIVQGLAVGGEYATSIVVLVESAPVRRRGFRGSLACLGATAGNLLGSAMGAFLFYNLDEKQIAEWGWRIPFLMGVAVALAGIYLRRKFTAEDCAAPNSTRKFFRNVLSQWPAALRVAGINIVAAIGFYMIFVYLVQYMVEFSHIGEAAALTINSMNMAVLLFIIPAAGYASDIIGRETDDACSAEPAHSVRASSLQAPPVRGRDIGFHCSARVYGDPRVLFGHYSRGSGRTISRGRPMYRFGYFLQCRSRAFRRDHANGLRAHDQRGRQ